MQRAGNFNLPCPHCLNKIASGQVTLSKSAQMGPQHLTYLRMQLTADDETYTE